MCAGKLLNVFGGKLGKQKQQLNEKYRRFWVKMAKF